MIEYEQDLLVRNTGDTMNPQNNNIDDGPLMRIPKFRLVRRHKKVSITIALFVILGIPLLVIIHQAYLFANAGNFQLYQPTKLPLGLKIVEKRLEIWQGGLFNTFVNSNFRLELSHNNSIFEEKYKKDPYYEPYVCDTVSNVNCHIYSTPKKQKYTVETVYFEGKPTSHTISFIKNNVSIHTTIESSKQIEKSEWSEFVDSFTPVSSANLERSYFNYNKAP